MAVAEKEIPQQFNAASMTDIHELAQQLRVDSIRCTTAAASGHPTSSMSAADLMAVLLAKYLKYDWSNPKHPNNDHLIFSKGHASPLLYSLYRAAGAITDDDLDARMAPEPLGEHVGGAIVIVREFKATEFVRLMEVERVTHTLIVPAMYQLCLLAPSFAHADLTAWRIGCYGGAPMAVGTIDALAERLPRLVLVNAYGATETTSPRAPR